MTLDEAIKHAEEVAEEKFNNAVSIMDKMKSDIALSNAEECKLCAEEHRQLAEWLKDYKRLKEQKPVLDKIRAEILEEKECAYADFGRYKVDYLGQDWEDVQDSLPQDDFRYGMERCIDIIDKYKAEFEAKDKVSQG